MPGEIFAFREARLAPGIGFDANDRVSSIVASDETARAGPRVNVRSTSGAECGMESAKTPTGSGPRDGCLGSAEWYWLV
jgi:hypothetical protein